MMEELTKYIVFKLNDQDFAVNVQQISSIEHPQTITKLPNSLYFIKGIINHRGEAIPVVDLKARLNMSDNQPTRDNRFLIVQMGHKHISLLVDSATEVFDIHSSLIVPAPEITGQEQETFIYGIAKLEERLITLLDLEQILDFNKASETKEVVKK